MAEQTGVTSSSGPGESRTAPARGKNKKLIYLGGAGVALLLLAHKGNGATGGAGQDPNAQLQAQSDALAQAQTDQALAAGAAGPLQPGGIAPTTIEGDNSTVTYPASSSTVNLPAGTSGAAGANASSQIADSDASLDQQVVNQDKAVVAADKKVTGKKPPHHQPPKHNKPKPAKKTGEVHHPSEGAKVQTHSGATAHGRTFPGARGVNIGGARTQNGNVYQDVTVDYGGHTETHTSVNGGKQWINHKKGANPPARGVQHTITPAGHANPPPAAPPRRSKGAPVRGAVGHGR